MPLTKSVSLEAGDSAIVEIECKLSNGLPALVIVGLASKAVDEAKDRIRAAFSTCKIPLPQKRITINLAPADIQKEGSSLDLAIAIAILLESKQVTSDNLGDMVIFGELGLDGTIRPVRGVIGRLQAAKKSGIVRAILPAENASQAMLVPGVDILAVENLREVYQFLSKKEGSPLKFCRNTPKDMSHLRRSNKSSAKHSVDMSHITGQQKAKRALEIAAAGGHNILMNGPPGTGKSMLAKALVNILPTMQTEEVLEVTHIHSLATRQYENLVIDRPFRAPHHSASEVSIVGGGQTPKPGEISLSHRGVLFFDELPEFKRGVIEALRQPLEDNIVSVSRAKASITYPANFMFVATCNPCPCGYYGTKKECSCSASAIHRYQQKMSGPILDRIDIHVDVHEVLHDKLLSDTPDGDSSEHIKERVDAARTLQRERYKQKNLSNSSLQNQEIKQYAQLEAAAVDLLNNASKQLNISARAYMKAVKLARTIADLDLSPTISVQHVSEALQYRQIKQQLL